MLHRNTPSSYICDFFDFWAIFCSLIPYMAIFKVLSEINLSLYSLFGNFLWFHNLKSSPHSLFGKKISFDRMFVKISLHSIFGNFFRFERNKFMLLFLIWEFFRFHNQKFLLIPYLLKKLVLTEFFCKK